MPQIKPDSLLDKALVALEDVYGPFKDLSPAEALAWSPPPAHAGHNGRYLWTDAFGVVDFITLFRYTSNLAYLHLAARLIDAVHNTLGRTRDLGEYLPGASAEHPLAGGLRIGKEDESGPDGDGQYHHYLTLWMFALNRMSVVSGEESYNDRAIELAEAIHPAFVVKRDSHRPRMYWKVSVDLSKPLVPSEGNLDPIDGFVICSMLQETSKRPEVLKREISDYKRILDAKWKSYSSDDPLDLGMTLWTTHWFAGQADWADRLLHKAAMDLHGLAVQERYFDRSVSQRLAFREFGACMGIACASDAQIVEDKDQLALRSRILARWEKVNVCSMSMRKTLERQGLRPITMVMYAAAILPGAFRKGFLGDD